jgi:hypothetical protein
VSLGRGAVFGQCCLGHDARKWTLEAKGAAAAGFTAACQPVRAEVLDESWELLRMQSLFGGCGCVGAVRKHSCEIPCQIMRPAAAAAMPCHARASCIRICSKSWT